MIALYDTLTKRKAPLRPLVPGQVGIYLCGPTVYNSAHVGHARPEMTIDVLRRWLEASGLKATVVRNFTDVEDKIIKRAAELGEDPAALAARYAVEYVADMDSLDIKRPSIEPRVSETIPGIIDYIERLIAAGKAYASGGDVYFAVDSFPPYGQLSGQNVADLIAGARVDANEDKLSPADFALWKGAKPGEPSWPSPWGPGRPGWHIECSAMASQHLGPSFDIHGGGLDLVFPHHENEIAQSQALTGAGSFAQLWTHNGLIKVNGEKMAKSLGNFFLLGELVKRFDRETFRLFMLLTHYRSHINFELALGDDGKSVVGFTSLDDAEKRLDYFYTTLERLDQWAATAGTGDDVAAGEVLPEAAGLDAAMRAAMDDDLNTAQALADAGEGMKLANRLLDSGKGVAKDVRARTLARLRKDLRGVPVVLGLLTRPPRDFLDARRSRLVARRGLDAAAIERRLADRDAARKSKDFKLSDEIRAELKALGVEVMDGPTGATWRVVD